MVHTRKGRVGRERRRKAAAERAETHASLSLSERLNVLVERGFGDSPEAALLRDKGAK
jgi:hypothetical protein